MSATTSTDHVSQLLQQLIAERALLPGHRVGTEAELARELNVSRPAVREAVRLLVRANLLRAARGPGGGVFVARSPDDGLARTVSDAIAGMLDDRHDLGDRADRGARAPRGAARGACRRARDGGDDLDSLALARARPSAGPTTRTYSARPTSAFTARSARRPATALAYALTAWSSEVLQPRLKDLIAPAIVEAVARDQHREIVIAIEAREPALAERAMRGHLRYLTDLLETVGALDGAGPPSPHGVAAR